MPQLFVSVVTSTHAVPQAVCPAGQLHAPALQVWPAAQALPHAPQLSGSVWNVTGSTQPVPHIALSAGHVATHAEPEQNGVAAGQTVPHAPQFMPSAAVLVQPLAHALSPV
jgi:hypothetical protein